MHLSPWASAREVLDLRKLSCCWRLGGRDALRRLHWLQRGGAPLWPQELGETQTVLDCRSAVACLKVDSARGYCHREVFCLESKWLHGDGAEPYRSKVWGQAWAARLYGLQMS